MNLFHSCLYRSCLLASTLVVSLAAQGQNVFGSHNHMGTEAQRTFSKNWNKTHPMAHLSFATAAPVRPFSEIENTGYVVINGNNEYELPNLRLAIAQNLPTGVTLVVYVSDQSQVPNIQSALGPALSSDRLKFLVIDSDAMDSDPLWARDSMPFPVYLNDTATPASYGLVGSIYPQDFEPNQTMATALSLPLTSTGQVFRGGNLLFDLKGNCFAENANEVADLSDPQTFFTQYFGCSTVTLLRQEGGIGDIDERIKFLSGNEALTDNADYQATLTQKGYTVHMIPTTGNDMETYMNTLIINGTIIVPQMGIPADKDAVAAYQALGFKAVGVVTKDLADDDNGNIHCLTMNYPPGSFVSNEALGSNFVKFAH